MSGREKLKRVFEFIDQQREGYITMTKLKKALVARPYVFAEFAGAPLVQGMATQVLRSAAAAVCLSQLFLFACLNCCLPVSTTVCLSQLLFACLNCCLPSTAVCPQLLFALN